MVSVRHVRVCNLLTLGAVLLALSAGPLRADAFQERIRQHVEQIREGVDLVLAGDAIRSRVVLPAFYEARGFEPAWSDPATRQDLLRAIDASAGDGLDPAHYHRAVLVERLQTGTADAAAVADLDVLLTDALVRLGHDLIRGRTDPATFGAHWSAGDDLDGLDPVVAVAAAIASGRPFEAVESFKPKHPLYSGLKAALAEMRRLVAAGGWEPVPDLGRLQVGGMHLGVPALRRRLAVTGELPPGRDLTAAVYDADVEAAVRRFQERHGLNADGVPGPRTLAAMNIGAAQRVDQIRVNLERARWVRHSLGDSYLAVNIAGFRLYVVRDGTPVWTTRVVVGRNHHETPLFRSALSYLVFNPTWTVPSSIARHEIVPKLRRDPGYLGKERMTLLDRSGTPVDPASVDLSPGAGFPYVVRQEPGPHNALGRVKFMFPNEHAVYLHDTPSRELFSRDARAFSHGCIRVENPLDLAELLLRDVPGWDRAAIDRAVDSGETVTVHLAAPLPVLLLYWTAWVDPRGELSFYDDVYGRDAGILAALDEVQARPSAAPR